MENKSKAEKRIKKLRDEIARLRGAYHIENAPGVTDDVYDSLARELEEILKKYKLHERVIKDEK